MAEVDEEQRRELIKNKLRELKITMKPKEQDDLARLSYDSIKGYFNNVEGIQMYMKEYDIYLSNDNILKLANKSWSDVELYFLRNKPVKPLVEAIEKDIEEVYHYSQEDLDAMYPQGLNPLDGTPIQSEAPKGYAKEYFLGPEEANESTRGRGR